MVRSVNSFVVWSRRTVGFDTASTAQRIKPSWQPSTEPAMGRGTLAWMLGRREAGKWLGTTPLSADYRETPYWWDRAPPPALPDAPLAREADVAVVGAGYTGLGAAIESRRLGRSVVLLEKHQLGFGASTRNGGMIHPGVKLELDELLRRFGELGERLFRFTVEAFADAERTISEEGIACDYERTGHLYLASRTSHVDKLRGIAGLCRERFDIAARFVPPDALGEEIGSGAFHGGLVVEKSGGLDPARYHAGLVQAAQRAGAEIHERTPALRLDRASDGTFEVHTPTGRIRARDVFVATNGYRDRLVPWLRRRIVPIGSYIIATEPLEAALAREVSPRGRMFFDSKNYLNYWRLSPDGRMLFGGRASMKPTTIARTRDTLYRAMVATHPQLEGVRVERAWGGKVGFTFDRLPHAGRRDGVYFAMGYGGTGVALASYLGRSVAAWMAHGDAPPFVEPRFPVLPAGAASERLLPIAGLYYQLRDRIG
jgi:glycine/D-amino acid oxidase-like deaminating enzyme